jgi:ATPase subunit of ABC transporter with duplicated ATPase domains
LITVTDLSLSFAGTKLFDHVNLKFLPGNCYGIIGANGAGKSTFLKILSGELEASSGDVSIAKDVRMSVLKQDHYAYDAFNVLDTVIQGNPRLFQIIQEKETLYAKEDFSEEDGILVSELEAEFSDLDGWDAETEAGKLLQGLGLETELLYSSMESLSGKEKVKVLLAQALFGKPEIILLDEPTNNLDVRSITWLEDFLLDYEGTVIVVSHDRHFLNTVCTHTVDIDYTSIRLYTGNYDFWYESSTLMQRIARDQNRKREDKIKDLENFVARFSANKSKSKQATSRKKLLEKLTIQDLPASSRRYPYVGFQMDREPGKEILTVEELSQTVEGVKVLDKISFRLNKGDKVAFVGGHDIANTALFRILVEEAKTQDGEFRWGVSTSLSYFPADNTEYFADSELNILQWLGQYAEDPMESYLRGFLGRMLFSGDDVFKPVRVLSGGERVRCMLARMMMRGSNVLILDQPTNHLDLESITALNNGLTDFKGIVLFASHDHQFIQTIANRIIELKPEGMVDRQTTYDEYLTLL